MILFDAAKAPGTPGRAVVVSRRFTLRPYPADSVRTPRIVCSGCGLPAHAHNERQRWPCPVARVSQAPTWLGGGH